VKRGTTGFVDFAPDYASPPGALLDAVLDALDLTQSDLADRTGLSTKYVNQIIKKHVTITAETAVRLEAATDVPADTWMRLEAQYRAEAARAERRRGLQAWVHWLRQFNLPELRQRGVVRSAGDDADVVDDLLRFFGISSPDSWERVWQSSLTRFRRSPSFKPELAATTVWLRIGQRKASALQTDRYDAEALLNLLPKLRRLTLLEPAEGLEQLPKLSARAGVAVVYSTEVSRCRASGATWWASPHKAVVLLSNRGKREDRLWFSFFHELGHLLRHAKRDTYIDQNGPETEAPPWEDSAPVSGFIDDGSRDSALELEADNFASSTLIPDPVIAQLTTIRSEANIETLAHSIGVAPGIVAGRWQFETGNYSRFNSLRRKLPTDLFEQPPPTPRG
jgi:HTH-type transcriptional regulator / antitoxin HigA